MTGGGLDQRKSHCNQLWNTIQYKSICCYATLAGHHFPKVLDLPKVCNNNGSSATNMNSEEQYCSTASKLRTDCFCQKGKVRATGGTSRFHHTGTKRIFEKKKQSSVCYIKENSFGWITAYIDVSCSAASSLPLVGWCPKESPAKWRPGIIHNTTITHQDECKWATCLVHGLSPL